MFTSVILTLLSFIGTASATAAAGVDTNCTTIDSTGTLVFTPAATVCSDNAASAVCAQLFGGATAPTTLPAPGGPQTNRPVTCYQTTTPAAPSQDIKNAAIETCPQYCGFCCVTPEYSCTNAPNPRLDCNSITQDMCQSTQWRTLIASDCPSACGFCLLGGCIDAAPDCSTQTTICGNTALSSFVASNCQRTCGLCTGSSTTSSSVGGTASSTACGDSNSNCAQWAKNGFCTNNFYSLSQRQQYCGTSCGLCSGK